MTEEDWCKACRAAEEVQKGWTVDTTTLRNALADLAALFRSAPWNVRSAYAELDERDLGAQAKDHRSTIEDRGFGWVHKAVGWRRSLKALAVQIRTIDAMLGDWDHRANRPPARSAREWRTSDGSAFVIPSRRPRDLGSKNGDGLGFSRRGTLRHRVIPTNLAGLPVMPVLFDGPAKRTTEELRLGAALFPGLSLSCDRTGSGFRAVEIKHDGGQAVLAEHLRRMEGVDLVVWPELAIDDDTLENISHALARQAIEGFGRPVLIVAGSWHRARATDGALANVAPILDSCGVTKAEHSKIVRYRHPQLGLEDIASGDRIVVLVCDGFLASVAICKDHCDLGEDPPWRGLDVDFLLVPSMGNATTMAGHLHHANGNRIHGGLRTVVSQQALPKGPDDALGFALLAPRHPPSEPAATRVDDTWSDDVPIDDGRATEERNLSER